VAGQEMYVRLAELLSYPRPDLPTLAGRAAETLAGRSPEAAALLAAFRAAAVALPPGRLEEVYSATFDLSPACCPYLGHHLFAESPKRARLLVGLKEAYAQVGLALEGEIPDHVCLVLRYLAASEDKELRADLRDEVLLPGLDKMRQALANGDNAYAPLLQATLVVARGEREASAVGGAGDV
jgi:nitrate reductase molybdenum cofactor assembly chaperone NarJ/NarW